jgi:polyhydroxybutyrate depolymerase
MKPVRYSCLPVTVLTVGAVVGSVVMGCGASNGGGTTGSGGDVSSSGGSPGSGGISSSGGVNGTGGAAAGSGGTVGSGGIGAGSGGASASGGASPGSGGRGGGSGTTTGGKNGGVPALGSGGAMGGVGPTGSGGAGGAATMSSGCGKAPPASNRYTIDVAGTSREYILYVPTNYDQNHPYRLIFAWHPLGGTAQQTAGTGNNGYYGMRAASNGDAILVSPEGLPFQGTSLGWGNTGGRDIDFLRAMLTKFKSEMCIDEGRIFSTGFSFGGMMSNAVGCAGLARAIAPMAGNSQVSGCQSGTQPVAEMGFHGTHDSVVDIAGGRKARDEFLKRNQCSADSMPTQPSWCDGLASNYLPCTCVSYQGCAAGYPVIWCEYNADHQAAPTSGPTIWKFFSQF